MPWKKYKLPRKDWVKGKSKFIFVRLAENNRPTRVQWHDVAVVNPWYKKLYEFIRRVFAKTKKGPAAPGR